MSKYWTNLFPLKAEWDNLNLYKYSVPVPDSVGKLKILNRLRYALSNEISSPVFYEITPNGANFYSFKLLEKENVKLSEEEIYYLSFEGKTKSPPPDNRSVEFVIEDVIRLRKLVQRFQNKFLETEKHPKYGKLLLYPYPFVKVYEDERFLLQVDFKFHLTTEKNLQQLFEEGLINPQAVERNENFLVRPKGFDRTAHITEVVKAVELKEDEIKNFFQISRQEGTKKIWEYLLGNKKYREKVFIVKLSNGYVYPALMVNPVLDFGNLEDITSEVLKVVKLPPKDRWKRIMEFTNMLSSALGDFNISLSPYGETVGEKNRIRYHCELVDSAGNTFEVKKSILPFLQKCKPFVKKPVLKTKILIILDTKDEIYNQKRKEFLTELKKFLEKKGIELRFIKRIGVVASSREEAIKKLSKGMRQILEGDPDLVIVFTPEYGKIKDLFRELTIYDYLKGKFLERGIASQFVLKKTLFQQKLEYVVYNVAEQIMGKTANVPYKLSQKLEGADVFIGIDISRIRKNSGGSVNEGAFTKIFFSDGSFLKYSLSSFPAMGEEVTLKAIQSLFLKLREEGIREGSTIVIHRDGNFKGKEVEIFTKLGEEFGYKLELVEVIKRNNPRFFGKDYRIKGLYYPLGDREAVVATYNNSFQYAHQPIRVKLVKGNLPLGVHISYLLSFTLLNYSSFNPVKLPATTYHTDKMAKMALRGLKPSKMEGEEMFWL